MDLMNEIRTASTCNLIKQHCRKPLHFTPLFLSKIKVKTENWKKEPLAKNLVEVKPFYVIVLYFV